MCVNVEVTMPVITSFLSLYTLRIGCFVTAFHTSLRTLSYIYFFAAIFLETCAQQHNWLAAYAMKIKEPPAMDSFETYFLFYCFETIVVADIFLVIHTWHLVCGLFNNVTHHFEYFLVCRFIVWLIELFFLTLLCIRHKSNFIVSWYLVMMMIVVFESYLFVTVYSYYVNILIEEEQNRCDAIKSVPCDPR